MLDARERDVRRERSGVGFLMRLVIVSTILVYVILLHEYPFIMIIGVLLFIA